MPAMTDSGCRILLIEDNPGDIRFVEELLKEFDAHNCELSAVPRLRDGISHAVEYRPDIILLDLSLPDSIGLDTFHKMFDAHPQIPIIILTGLKDEDLAINAIRSGAQDYLVKGKFDEVLLYRAMQYAVERKRIEAALRESEEKYRASQLQLQNLAARLQDIREEERKKIAREVHDELGQLLTGIRLQLTLLERDTGDNQERIDNLYVIIDQAIQSVKRIASELRPVILDVLGLSAAIEWQTTEFQAATGTECALSSTPDADDAAGDISIAIFRIYQEVLTNIARHAQASNVRVHLSRTNGHIELEVSDDGIGIDKSVVSNRESLGLLGMKERARQLNGNIKIEKGKESGTVVFLRVPWKPNGKD